MPGGKAERPIRWFPRLRKPAVDPENICLYGGGMLKDQLTFKEMKEAEKHGNGTLGFQAKISLVRTRPRFTPATTLGAHRLP